MVTRFKVLNGLGDSTLEFLTPSVDGVFSLFLGIAFLLCSFCFVYALWEKITHLVLDFNIRVVFKFDPMENND
jgi:hypothetical protein